MHPILQRTKASKAANEGGKRAKAGEREKNERERGASNKISGLQKCYAIVHDHLR